MKRLFIALTYGLWAVSALANAQVRGEDSYIPPDYDVGHPQLISEAKVLLTESELAKKSYNRPRKLASVAISNETIVNIKEQANALIPRTPTYKPGDGQTNGTPLHERDLIVKERNFLTEQPILKLQISIPALTLNFDGLTITSIYKRSYRSKPATPPTTFIDVKAKNLQGTITIKGEKLKKVYLRNNDTVWEILRDEALQYYLYRSTYLIGGNDTITPDPKEVEKAWLFSKHHHC